MKNNLFFLDFFVDLFFVNFRRTEVCKFDQISKSSKISTCKSLSQWSIRLNAIYDALIKVLISSWYSSDSITGSFSTVRKNNKLILEMASWFLLFWHIFSRILYALFYKGWYTVLAFYNHKDVKTTVKFFTKIIKGLLR